MEARQEAFEILQQVIIEGGYASLIMQKRLKNVKSEDKKLITQLVYGTLENYRYVRFLWSNLAKVRTKVAILLDLSVYQLIFMDSIPDYAITNEAVEMAKKLYRGNYCALVNAVLHKVSKNGKVEPETIDLKYSYPEWVYKMWCAHYGNDVADKLVSYRNTGSNLALRVNPTKTTKAELLKDPAFEAGKLADSALIYHGNFLESSYFADYSVFIQDEASQLVIPLLDPQANERILDMCAAPGTKTIQMAQQMGDTGEIIALDLYPHRVALIDSLKNKLNIKSITTKAMDASEAHNEFEQESFDRVLLDAPCSGLGVLVKKPDLKLRVSPEGIDEIVSLQAKLLDEASVMVKKEGIIVYSTCTLNKKENDRQIYKFLQRHDNFSLIEERTVFPYQDNTDGFYMAKLIKNN